MTERKYLPTIGDLIDRLSITLMKSIFIPENRAAYREEMDLIKYDIDMLLPSAMRAEDVYKILVLMLANREIWLNESKARLGGPEQDKLLKFTHSINGIRNAAKNWLSWRRGDRQDAKVDCLAGDLPPEFGNWQVFR